LRFCRIETFATAIYKRFDSLLGDMMGNFERPPRRLLCAIPFATMLAAMGGLDSAFAQSCTGQCATLQAADQEALLSPFNSLLDSPAGMALLMANLQAEENIYLNSTQAEKIASGTVLIVPDIPANILLRAFPTNPNFGYTPAGLPNAPALPSNVTDATNDIENNSQIDAMKPYFGAVNSYGIAYGLLPGQTDSLGNPPPYQVSSAILNNPFTPANSSLLAYQNQQTPGANINWALGDSQIGDFPSAHTWLGTIDAITYAILAPGYYQQLAQSVAEFAYDLNVYAAHYPLDVIGGRIVGTYVIAETLAGNPLYPATTFTQANLPSLSQAMQTYLGGGGSSPYAAACANLVACLGNGTIPTEAAYAQAAQNYAYYLTYDLPSVGPTNLAPVVPADAYVLIETRFPYLSVDQLNEILATTELPSGVPLDNGSGWARLNLYAAAGGYGAFPSNVTVNMNAALGGLNAFDVWSNNISGPGGLTLQGSGTLVLAGDDTFTGGVNVQGGALGVTGSLLGPLSVSSGATLVLGSTGVFAGVLTNDGSVTNEGVMTGTFAGSGAFANSGFLSGVGGFGSLDLLSGSTIALGNSIGVIQVAGDLAAAAGATYQAKVAGNSADQIQVGGTATLSGGAVVASVIGASAELGHAYPILVATGGVNGAFANVSADNLPFIQPSLSYETNDVFLTLARNGVPYASVATTPNQAAVANAVSAGPAGSGLDLALDAQSAAGARQAFDALSGEIHPSAVSAAFDDARLPREAVLDRLASSYGALATGGANGFAATNAIAAPSLPAQMFAAWGQAFGSFGHIGGDGDAAALDRSLGGFILGADASLDNRYRLGVAGGYAQSVLSLDARASSGHVDSTFAGVYGGASLDGLQLRGGALYAYNRYGTDRSIAFSGFSDTASAGYGGDTAQAFGEAGWRIGMAGFSGPTSIEPFVGAMAMRIDTASFAEAGGPAALNGAAGGYDDGATTLGVRAEASLFDNMALIARGMLGWRHVFGDVTPTSTLAFASAPSTQFAIAGAPIARDALAVEAGFDWRLSSTASIGVFYSGALAARDQDNVVKGKVEVAF
jgi:autotransporter-associated beta strand protein